MQLAEFGTGAARERALLQAGLLQQGFGQAQAARQQDIANRFGLAQAQQQGLGGFQSGLGSTSTTRFTTITRNRYCTFRSVGRTEPGASTSTSLMHKEKQQDKQRFYHKNN